MSSFLPHLKVIEAEKTTIYGLPPGNFKDDNYVQFPLDDKHKPFHDMLLIHRCVQLVGPGGTGKTYFAVEAARRMRILPKLFLSFKNKSTLIAQLASLGREAKSAVIGFYKAHEVSDLRVLGKKFRENLEKNKEYFLILDNLSEDEFLEGFMENGPLEKGFVIVASRTELESAPQIYKMTPLDQDSCISTLTAKFDGNETVATMMYKICEGIPLKLSQLFHYLEETNQDLDQFISDGIAGEKILALTVETLVNSQSDVLFACLKYLNSSHIPEAFLQFVGNHFSIDAEDMDNFFEDILAFEFCQPTNFEGILRLHDELQENLPELKTTVQVIWTLYNDFLTNMRRSDFGEQLGPFEIEQKMRQDLKKWGGLHENVIAIGRFDQQDAEKVTGNPQCLINLGTALFLLPFNMESVLLGKRLDELIKSELSHIKPDTPRREFDLKITACNYLNSAAVDRGMNRRSLENFERMLELEKEHGGGEESERTINIRVSIASELQRMGKVEESYIFRKQVLEWRSKNMGPEHPDTLSAMNNFAISLKQKKQYVEALELRERVMQLTSKRLGDEHPDSMTAMNNLAMSLKDSDLTEMALDMMKNVLELRKTHLGEDHPDTLTAMNNMASILSAKGEYREALQVLKSVYELRKRIMGLKHRLTMATLNNMAAVHGDLGEFDEALKLQKKVLELRKKVQGDHHPATKVAANGVLYFESKIETALKEKKEKE